MGYYMAVVMYCRWEVISNFIKQHVPESNKTAKDVLAKAKDLQKNGIFLLDILNFMQCD